jgi:sterol desaturase/sphingolipid hydroxylase (fatty acid hydroxylase superfamily)
LKLLNSIIVNPINYWLALISDVFGLCVLSLICFQQFYAPSMIIVFLVGLIMWSFIEYALHRWFLHGQLRFAECHTNHHIHPRAACGVPAFSIQVVVLAIWTGLSVVMTLHVAAWLALGLFAGYNCYSLLHHAQHNFGLFRSDRHEIHHWDKTVNFGVTTSLWDRVFQTG